MTDIPAPALKPDPLAVLIADIKAGTVPSRELDARMWCELQEGWQPWVFEGRSAGWVVRDGPSPPPLHTNVKRTPEYTSSVDAVLAEVRERGFDCMVSMRKTGFGVAAEIGTANIGWQLVHGRQSPALAASLALMLAVQAERNSR